MRSIPHLRPFSLRLRTKTRHQHCGTAVRVVLAVSVMLLAANVAHSRSSCPLAVQHLQYRGGLVKLCPYLHILARVCHSWVEHKRGTRQRLLRLRVRLQLRLRLGMGGRISK